MKTILLSCGGTGGHLAPGIALAQRFTRQGLRCVLAVSRKEVDARLAEAYPQLVFRPCAGAGLTGGLSGLARFVASQTVGLSQAWGLIQQERPDLVVAFGGFLSAPFMLAGRLKGVPLALHEANAVPGRVTRLFARWVQRLYLPAQSESPLAALPHAREAPFPLREEMQPVPKAEARRALGFPEHGRLLIVLGGSQGAAALNDWAQAVSPSLLEAGIHLLCLTGTAAGSGKVCQKAETCHQWVPFSDRMPLVLSAADAAVARAGAGTIAELARCRVPAWLVPYPFAADDHQLANARRAASLGGAQVIAQNELTEATEEVLSTMRDEAVLQARAAAMAGLDRPEAEDALVEDLCQLAQEAPVSK